MRRPLCGLLPCYALAVQVDVLNQSAWRAWGVVGQQVAVCTVDSTTVPLEAYRSTLISDLRPIRPSRFNLHDLFARRHD